MKGKGCRLHRVETHKLSHFLIHLKLIEMQGILTLHYLFTSFRKKIYLSVTKYNVEIQIEASVGKLCGKGQFIRFLGIL